MASLCHLAVSLRDQGKTHAGELLLRRAGEIRSKSRGAGRIQQQNEEGGEDGDGEDRGRDGGGGGEGGEEQQQQQLSTWQQYYASRGGQRRDVGERGRSVGLPGGVWGGGGGTTMRREVAAVNPLASE